MVQLVGILNITPDSFSDGGQFADADTAIQRVGQLLKDGASFVDVGAESTRPGATPLTAAEEQVRLESVLPTLLQLYPGKISLDTYHPETVNWALEQGGVIINDVTGMTNPAMIAAVTAHGASCVVSHLPTLDIQAAHLGELVNSIQAIVDDLLAKESILRAEGLEADQIILDPGIGFGKTPELNRQLLGFAEYVPGKQVMIGYSRKRFLGDDRMELGPNLEAGKIAIAAGAAFLRVHDVAGHRQLLS